MEFLVLGYHARTIDIPKGFIKVAATVLCSKPQMLMLESFIAVYEKIVSNLRISLENESINDILAIKINGPVVSEVDLRPLVLQWLDNGRDVGMDKEHLRQRYYSGFFSQAKKKKGKVKTSTTTTWDLEENDWEWTIE